MVYDAKICHSIQLEGGCKVARWRQPVIIWLRRVRKNSYWNHKPKGIKHPLAPPQIPWMSGSLYVAALVVAALVLWNIPNPSLVIPTLTKPSIPSRPSFVDKALAQASVSRDTFEAWLNQGIPLLGIVMNPNNFQVHWDAFLLTSLRMVTGVRLNSLDNILKAAIPVLGVVPARPPGLVQKSSPKNPLKVPRSKAQNAQEPTLPGDHHRIWAELGVSPTVGIYQTHSHESFWPYVPRGAVTAYSTQWTKTIVQVGWWLALDLHTMGVSVVQSRVDNMSEGLLASYNKSYYTAKQLLQWYPSVRLMIDLHRGPNTVTPARIQGTQVSRVVIVVGTNKLLPNAYWHQNLEVALKLSKALAKVAPGILVGKGVDVVPYRYNQQLMAGDLMVEVGGPNSTLSEERYAVRDLAQAMERLIKSDGLPKGS